MTSHANTRSVINCNVNSRHNHDFHLQHSSWDSLKSCCYCLLLLFTFLGLLLTAVTLFIFLAIKPKKPHVQLQQVSVHYLLLFTTTPTAAAAAGSSVYITLNISMLFTASNPNKVAIKYSTSDFHLMYKGHPLTLAQVPTFYQPAHSLRALEISVAVNQMNVGAANAAGLVEDAVAKDRVDLRIAGLVAASTQFMDISSPKVKVSVDCWIVISPRRQLMTAKQCGLDGLSI